MYHRCWAKANFFLFRFEFNSKAGRKFAQRCFNQDSCECRQVICLSLTYSGRKCDGWTAAFNRGSLLCLGATPSPSAPNPPHPPPPTSQQPRPLLDDHMGSPGKLGLNLTLTRLISDEQTFDLNACKIFEWDKPSRQQEKKSKIF